MSLTVIESGRTERQYWHDIWRYRELFYVLAWRDFSIRYRQTAAGVVWALVQPFVSMIVFTVIFGKLARMPAGDVPYPLLVFAGILPWQFFAQALSGSSQSIVGNANLISKIYFPRLIIPATSVITALVDFCISFLLMIMIMIWYGYMPPPQILLLPFFILMGFLTSLGPGLLVTALNVKYRDFRYIIPFVLQLGMYISPVGFSSSVVDDYGNFWRMIYSLNPVVGVIDGFRWCLLGGQNHIYMPGFLLSLTTTAITLWIGVTYFRKAERTFADVI